MSEWFKVIILKIIISKKDIVGSNPTQPIFKLSIMYVGMLELVDKLVLEAKDYIS